MTAGEWLEDVGTRKLVCVEYKPRGDNRNIFGGKGKRTSIGT